MKNYVIYINGKAIYDYAMIIAARKQFFEIAKQYAINNKDVYITLENLTTGQTMYEFTIYK